MKPWKFFIHTGLLAVGCATAQASSQINFDFDWRFHLGDVPEAASAEFDDKGWRQLELPHDFSIESDFNRSNVSSTAFLPGGVAWYRKTFALPSSQAGDWVSVEFDGVSRSSEVWLNGHRLGEHAYGYTPFNFDLTPYLNPGGPNVLAVRVDRSRVDDSRWYPGSGIIRHVWLETFPACHTARHGIFISTPSVNAGQALIRVQTRVQNNSKEAQEVTIETSIIAPNGDVVLTMPVQPGRIPANDELAFEVAGSLQNPQLWSLKSPTIYRVRTIVQNGSANSSDVVETSFGIRSIQFEAAKGFSLNGEPIKLHGVCVHQDAGGLGGAAMLDVVWRRRLEILRDMGVNAIRCSHNPAPAFFYDLCDRLGLLVIDEAFDEWNGAKRKWVEGWNVGTPSNGAGYSEYFDKWAEADVREMVLRSRNHPSVIMWSIGNEIDYPDDPFSYPTDGKQYDPKRPSADILAQSGKKLARLVRQLDPTRPVTAGLANLKTSNATGLADELDVVGYNYQFEQYAPDMAKYPARKFVGSENGYGPNYFDLTQENPRVAGQFLWVGIDYLGEAKRWPLRGWDDGLLDTCGIKKPRAAYRQALWSDKPMVYVCVRAAGAGSSTRSWQGEFGWAPLEAHWNWQGDARTTLPIVVYSNCREVELFLNGRSLGAHKADSESTFRWETAFEPGELKAVAKATDGRTVQDSLVTAGEMARIELLAEKNALIANGEDAVHVEIRALDAKGVLVPLAAVPCSITLSGAGTLAGLDNGDQSDMTRLTNPERKLHRGRALALVRSSRSTGTIKVTVRSPGLPEAQLNLRSE
jgi:beta-galactosidase